MSAKVYIGSVVLFNNVSRLLITSFLRYRNLSWNTNDDTLRQASIISANCAFTWLFFLSLLPSLALVAATLALSRIRSFLRFWLSSIGVLRVWQCSWCVYGPIIHFILSKSPLCRVSCALISVGFWERTTRRHASDLYDPFRFSVITVKRIRD